MIDKVIQSHQEIHLNSSALTIEYWQAGSACCDSVWEAAYRRFETPHQELKKFQQRLSRLGLSTWNRDLDVVELFCGQGAGLVALENLGFQSIAGVDLSPHLLEQYQGPAKLYVGDCRDLKFEDHSCDVLIVQGGLHHLSVLPQDLKQTLQEMHRVLRQNGRIVIVEPWLTPFLSFVHRLCGSHFLRSVWPKLDALSIMIEQERTTYEQWLSQPDEILELLSNFFQQEQQIISYGKLMYVGRKL